jgi:DNA-binding response OmpR family regulator
MKDEPVMPDGDPSRAAPECLTRPPRRILLVDDEATVRRLNAQMLRRSGYEVDDAADGAAAWEALQTRHYDLLITDNSMPKVSGVELVLLLRGQNSALPVIMASGAIPTEELERNPSLAINVILLKPYTVVEMLGTVRDVLRATDDARDEIATPPNRPGQPSADGLAATTILPHPSKPH